jgi:hypothetical protein
MMRMKTMATNEGEKVYPEESTWGKIQRGICPYYDEEEDESDICPDCCARKYDPDEDEDNQGPFCAEFRRMQELGHNLPAERVNRYIPKHPWEKYTFEQLEPPLSDEHYVTAWGHKVEIIHGDVWTTVPKDHWFRQYISENKQFMEPGFYKNVSHPDELIRVIGMAPEFMVVLFRRK